ncbi:MAG: LacI family DNA-binding transcriptional regulator [Oscillospiraceae bacterium]|nr:LacI family DNA-binding transcriptional regulator [Oscillospiraceae bacterium]
MITLSKIAKEAHVSVSTASKAFSGSPEVNEETRQAIFDVAKKYGCFKKFFNAKYSKYVIAIICPEFGSIHYANYLSFLRQNLEQKNCEICVAESGFSPEKEAELLNYYYKHVDVDAIIVIEPSCQMPEHADLPVLFLGPIDESGDCPSVFCDVDTALEDSIRYLKSKGVDKIGFLGEALTTRKLLHFQNVLNKQGLVYNENFVQIAGQRFEPGGYMAMEKLLQSQELPRAVICAYDAMAIGALRCLADHGLRVPEDIAILGMDDIPQAPYLNPPLASINSQIDVLCALAATTVIAQINNNPVPSKQRFPSSFKLRRSFEID